MHLVKDEEDVVTEPHEIDNFLDYQYLSILNEINEQGITKKDRTGTGTKSIFGTSIRVSMQDGFPLLTSKKVFTKGVIYELLWLLGKHVNTVEYGDLGITNIKYLTDNGVNIWVGDALKAYNKFNPKHELTQAEFIDKINTDHSFCVKYGDLGPVYGEQWTDWGGINQIEQVIDKLKNNPDDRGIMVSAWNVAELDEMVLRPCHYNFQFWTRELTDEERKHLLFEEASKPGLDFDIKDLDIDKFNIPTRTISLMWNQRSADFPLGVPFNIASYGFLLSMIAKIVNMVPDELIGVFGDSHIYLNQTDKIKQQLFNKTYKLPTLRFNPDKTYNSIEDFEYEDFIIENYENSGVVNYPLSN